MPADRDVDAPHEVSSFVLELRRLADALESGTAFTIDVDGETVAVPHDAMMSVAHEREDGQVELEFQLTWTEQAAVDTEAGDQAADASEPGVEEATV